MQNQKYFTYGCIIVLIIWIIGATYIAFDFLKWESDQNYLRMLQRIEEINANLNIQIKESGKLMQVIDNYKIFSATSHSSSKSMDYERIMQIQKPKIQNDDPIAVLVIACNRPVAVKNLLNQLIEYEHEVNSLHSKMTSTRFRPSEIAFPIIVSQDCGDKDTVDVIRSYGNHIDYIQQPDHSWIHVPFGRTNFRSYYNISRHYKFALDYAFSNKRFQAAIIVEDDLVIAPDFFEYFRATYSILKADKSLICVSAWNDNGLEHLVDKTEAALVHRTDFFPGLGWMLRKELWDELKVKWPVAFWDDWLRDRKQRLGRACLRPEISRTAMGQYAEKGASKGLFFESHLSKIHLNQKPVNFTSVDLSYLHKEIYDLRFVQEVYGSTTVTLNYFTKATIKPRFRGQPQNLRITYADAESFHRVANFFGLMNDFRSGVPRTAYRGVVSFKCHIAKCNGTRIFLAPPATWTDYHDKWN